METSTHFLPRKKKERNAVLHATLWMRFAAWAGLHDLVESLVGHDPADEELTSAHVVQGQRLDLGDVNAHLPVDPAALDAHNNTWAAKVSCQFVAKREKEVAVE